MIIYAGVLNLSFPSIHSDAETSEKDRQIDMELDMNRLRPNSSPSLRESEGYCY